MNRGLGILKLLLDRGAGIRSRDLQGQTAENLPAIGYTAATAFMI